MDYIAPLNRPATVAEPRPAYFNGNAQTGQEGSYPSGTALENPMREILAVIEGAGITPTNADLTQLYQAIGKLIATALANYSPPGGGGPAPVPASFLLNPIYPHITVNGGIMSVASANAQVSIPAGQTFIHRGGVLYNSTDTLAASRTFSTVASKTYHLRWRYNGGAPAFVLLDLANVAYNAGGLAETHASFDSAFDDMLIARVVTDAANMPTVTALLNKQDLGFTGLVTGTGAINSGANGANYRCQKTLNWARTPATSDFSIAKSIFASVHNDHDYNTFAATLPRSPASAANANPTSIPIDRYGLDCIVLCDDAVSMVMQLACGA